VSVGSEGYNGFSSVMSKGKCGPRRRTRCSQIDDDVMAKY
jgi:hypothetical protein